MIALALLCLAPYLGCAGATLWAVVRLKRDLAELREELARRDVVHSGPDWEEASFQQPWGQDPVIGPHMFVVNPGSLLCKACRKLPSSVVHRSDQH